MKILVKEDYLNKEIVGVAQEVKLNLMKMKTKQEQH
jgi:hypothetical protein